MNEKYRSLIDKIILGSKNKTIKWEQTSRDDRFKAKIGIGAVTIEKNIYFDINEIPYSQSFKFVIINSEGIDADSFSINEDNEVYVNDYLLLNQLYEVAKDSYLKISDTVQSMLDELDLLDGF